MLTSALLFLLLSGTPVPPDLAIPAGASALGPRLAAEAMAFAEAEAAKLPGSYRLRLVQSPAALPLSKGDVRIDSFRLSKADPSGRFFVTAKLLAEGRPAGFARVDFEGTWTGYLLRVRDNLARKTVLDPAQLESASFEGTPPPGALTSLPEGMRLRQAVTAGKVLTRADLEPIPLVQAGERVKLTAATPGLTILAEGTARGTGGQGDRIRVEVLGTRRLVQAIVAAPGETRLAGFEPGK